MGVKPLTSPWNFGGLNAIKLPIIGSCHATFTAIIWIWLEAGSATWFYVTFLITIKACFIKSKTISSTRTMIIGTSRTLAGIMHIRPSWSWLYAMMAVVVSGLWWHPAALSSLPIGSSATATVPTFFNIFFICHDGIYTKYTYIRQIKQWGIYTYTIWT